MKYDLTLVMKSGALKLINEEISTPDMFLDSVSSVNLGPGNKYNYTLQLLIHGIHPDWKDEIHLNDGRFVISFATNIKAIRAFCLFGYDWINNLFGFSNQICEITASIRQSQCQLQIWVKDGFSSDSLSSRMEQIIQYFKTNHFGVDNSTDIISIDYNVNQGYKDFTFQRNTKFPSYSSIIERFVPGLKSQELTDDYDEVTYFKRSRKERREAPSFVDQV